MTGLRMKTGRSSDGCDSAQFDVTISPQGAPQWLHSKDPEKKTLQTPIKAALTAPIIEGTRIDRARCPNQITQPCRPSRPQDLDSFTMCEKCILPGAGPIPASIIAPVYPGSPSSSDRPQSLPGNIATYTKQQVGASITEGFEKAYNECKANVERIAKNCRAKNRKFRYANYTSG